jgi:LAS superfamily LD-carboxypeptidase LdcB
MNSRFELEAFGSQPFNYEEEEFGSELSNYEEEEEVRRSRGRAFPARRSAGMRRPTAGRKPVAARKFAGRRKPQAGKRPKRPIKRPVIRPFPFPAWPGIGFDPISPEPRPGTPPQGGPPPQQGSSGGPPPPERPERVDDDRTREGNERVRWVQVSLNNLLSLNLPTDGVMGAATRAAVRSFQRRENLPVTGVVGPDTEQALVAATRSATGATTNGAPAGTAPDGIAGDTATSDSPADAATSSSPADATADGGADQETPWLSSVLPGLTEFEFEPLELPMEFEAGPFGEFESTGVCPSFTPVAVENPGGGRVKNKTAPRPGDIVRVKRAFGGTVPLHRLTAKALDAMQCAARADGIKAPVLQLTSGFRDPAHQARLWANALQKYGSPEEARKWVAPPGGSAHQSGRAVDLYLGGKNSSANVTNLRTLPAYRWLVANAGRFGFYPYEREPWHWEYNPQASRQSEIFHEFQEFEEEFEDEGVGPIQDEFATPVAAPSLIGQEQTPPGRTLYVNIPLGAERPAKPMTGIFIPQHFQPEPKVDLIIYLHGIKPKADLTINRYWNRSHFPTWPLREEVNQSGKNFVLVAPTLGPRSQTQTGWLAKPGGLDKYVDQVLAALAMHGPYQGRRPQLGNIILACHSGGGLPMRQLAMGKNRCAGHIKECWGFDCLYFTGDENLWAQWAKSRPDARLFIHYQGSTRERSEKLKQKKVPNIIVSLSVAKGHNWVPIHHWQERLASTLQARRPGPTARPSQEWGQEWSQEWGWGGISDWFSRWGSPSTSPALPSQSSASALRARAVALANQEWNRWGKGKINESDPKLRPVIEGYWRNGPGYKPSEPNWWSAVPWSAAFISWVMQKAGAGADFKYSGAHAAYTAAAKQNRLANNNNPFKAYRTSEVKPRVGDLVCKSRSGSGATYDNIAPGMATHCDIVTAVGPNRLVTVGGNVSNSVNQTPVPTDANGFINKPGYFAVIKVGA